MVYIVAYDIEDNRKRGRLAKFLLKKGRRLQKSVFAVTVERHAFKGFCHQIVRIAGRHEQIAMFRLCAGCRDSAIRLGEEEPQVYVF